MIIGSQTLITHNLPFDSSNDIYLVKYDSNGTVLWARNDGSPRNDIVRSLSTDGDGNSYLTGNINNATPGDLSFAPIVLPFITSNDFYVVKYDSFGNVMWVNNTGLATGYGVHTDNNGNVAITGEFSGSSLTIAGVTITKSNPNGQVFTAKLNSSGNVSWLKTENGVGGSQGANVRIDSTGNILIGAMFNGTSITIDTSTFTCAGSNDIMVFKYDPGGNVLWSEAIQSSGFDRINDIAINANGDELISGLFLGAILSFSNTTLNNTLASGSYDLFFINYQGENSIVWTGNNSDSWTSPFNWEPQQLPTVDDNVSIPAGRPFDPVIRSGAVAECKKLTIADGAVLRMNAGTLNVYGKITATSSSAFQLNGGGMHLFHGSVFPENMTFNNLTIKNENDVDSDNIYKFNGATTVNGNFKVFGTASKPNLPKIVLEEYDEFFLFKNLVLSSGTLGWPYINSIPADRSQLPALYFLGSGVQNISISNQSSVQNSSVVDCNIYMGNSLAKFTLPNRELSFFNLIVNDNFNLAGKRLSIVGKIVYNSGFGSSFKITNSIPSRGSISIFNDALLVYDTNEQMISMDKVRSLRCNLTSPSTNTILQTALAADTLEVKGYLDLNGQNLTIGSTSTNLGTLDVDSMGTSITQGTLFLYGNAVNPPYHLVAKALNNLVLNNPNGVVLDNAIDIPLNSPNWSQMLLYGTAKLTTGSFDLNGSLVSLVKNTLTNSPNVAKIVETPFNTFLNFGGTGAGPGLRIDTNVTTAITNKNYGGLGFVIQSNVPLNQLSIVRSPIEQTGINGGSSIFRTYTIYNQGSTPGMNAFVSIDYDDIELGGVNESDLSIYRRSSDDPAGVWNPVGSIVFPSTNTVTSFGTSLTSLDYSTSVGGFTQYTLASTSDPLRNVNQSRSNSKVNVYPNPFTSELSVQFTSAITESATLQVFDFTGKSIEERSVQLNKGGNNINLCCVDELPAGIYFLKITSSQTNSIVKVVKQ